MYSYTHTLSFQLLCLQHCFLDAGIPSEQDALKHRAWCCGIETKTISHPEVFADWCVTRCGDGGGVDGGWGGQCSRQTDLLNTPAPACLAIQVVGTGPVCLENCEVGFTSEHLKTSTITTRFLQHVCRTLSISCR